MSGTRDVRHRLIAAAGELLRDGGLPAATPAAVAERAGAGKMSLYRHFEGKDELVTAALAEGEEHHRARLLAGDDPAAAPRDRVLAVFLRAADRADVDGFRGCPYVIASFEAHDVTHAVVDVARAHKQLMQQAFSAMLAGSAVADPEQLAAVLLMLFDGAVVHAVLAGDGSPLRAAAAVVADLV